MADASAKDTSATGASTTPEIFSDPNFQKLASKDTASEEFRQLVSENVVGYRQKKRLQDGLKVLQPKVETIENKLIYAKQLGKAKSNVDAEEKLLCDNHKSSDLQEKVKLLNQLVQAMIDEGQLTASEKPEVLENLDVRQTKAKSSGKDALVEKLEKSIKSVLKVTPIALPVTNLKEIHELKRKEQEIQRLEKQPAKSLNDKEREMMSVSNKVKIENDLERLEESSRMWFETAEEFKPRMEQAVEERAKNLAELLRKEAEEAAEKKRLDDQRMLEEKRQKEAEKQDQLGKAMLEKLEARRKEAQATKPEAARTKAQPKKKKQAKQMNPYGLFLTPEEMKQKDRERRRELGEESEDEDEQEQGADEPAETTESQPEAKLEKENIVSEKVEKAEPPAPEPKPAVKPAAKTEDTPEKQKKPAKVVKAPVVLENKWATGGLAPEKEGDPSDENGPSMAEAAKVAPILEGPDLAAAAKPVKKTPPPQPKKKEKKKFTKLGASDLGFDANNPNYIK